MPKNILVIDDDGLVTKSLCALFGHAGYSADASQNGFDALEKIKDTHIDLIIVDIRMPEMDGVQTVKKIKELLKARHRAIVPVIFITGYADPELNRQAEEIGEVLLKPFDNAELMARLSKYV